MTTTLDSIGQFEPHLGSAFTLQTGGEGGHPLELVEVGDLTAPDENRSPDVRKNPFRLTFRSAEKKRYFPQQIHRLAHPELGELEIFLVPIGPDSLGMCYEAIFN